MFDPVIGRNPARVYSLGDALTTVTNSAPIAIKSSVGVVTSVITIADGSARTVQLQGSLDGDTFFNIGTSRTTTGTFCETVPSLPYYQLDMSATTDSTASGSIYA